MRDPEFISDPENNIHRTTWIGRKLGDVLSFRSDPDPDDVDDDDGGDFSSGEQKMNDELRCPAGGPRFDPERSGQIASGHLATARQDDGTVQMDCNCWRFCELNLHRRITQPARHAVGKPDGRP